MLKNQPKIDAKGKKIKPINAVINPKAIVIGITLKIKRLARNETGEKVEK